MNHTHWDLEGKQVDPQEPDCVDLTGHVWEAFELPSWRRPIFRVSCVISSITAHRCRSCGLVQRDYYMVLDPGGRPIMNATEYLQCT